MIHGWTLPYLWSQVWTVYYLCLVHALFISCSFLIHVLFMSYSYLVHVLLMSYLYLIHVLFMPYSYRIHVLFISCSRLIHILFTSYSCLIHILFMSYSCLVHVLFIHPGKPVNPQLLFHHASCSIICSIMYSARYEYHHPFFQTMVKMMAECSKIANGPWGMVGFTLEKTQFKKSTWLLTQLDLNPCVLIWYKSNG